MRQAQAILTFWLKDNEMPLALMDIDNRRHNRVNAILIVNDRVNGAVAYRAMRVRRIVARRLHGCISYSGGIMLSAATSSLSSVSA